MFVHLLNGIFTNGIHKIKKVDSIQYIIVTIQTSSLLCSTWKVSTEGNMYANVLTTAIAVLVPAIGPRGSRGGGV